MKDDLILVGGAGGFIGGHLVADLLAGGCRNIRAVDIKPLDQWRQSFDEVENIRSDLSILPNCQKACRDANVVYNLAANMGGMGFIEKNKALCMLSVLINTHMLIAARNHGAKRYFYSSSACVYNGGLQQLTDAVPLKEADAYPAMPEDGYGWEKLFSERLCCHFRDDFALDTRVYRFHNTYGPFGAWDDGREKAPAAICRKVIECKATGNHEIEIWGNGQQTRSFMYVDDCIEGIRRLMASEATEPMNLGSTELVTINHLVDIVEEVAGVKLTRKYNLDAPLGVVGRNSDNSMLQDRLGWQPGISLRDGVEKTYAWIHDRYMAKYG